MNGDNGDHGEDLDDDEEERRPARPLPFVLSAAAGAFGVVVLVIGLVTGNRPLLVAGFVFGSLSLGFALYWRSQLVTAWAAQKGRRPRP